MKKIFLLFMLLLLTGCTVDYNLEFKNKKYCESLDVKARNSEGLKDYLDSYYNGNISLYYNDDDEELATKPLKDLINYKFYNKSIIKSENNYGFNLNHCFDKDFKDSRIINTLFDSIDITSDHLKANGIKDIFDTYSDLTDVTISFKSDKYIKKINADLKKDDVYYWYINKENYKNKYIYIEYTDTFLETIDLNNNKDIDNYIDIIIISLGIIILVVALIIYYKFKKTSK